MKVYFDEKNLISLFRSIDGHPMGNEVLQILKKQLDLFFNFSKESISDELEDQLSEFTEGVGRNRHELSIQFSKLNFFSERPISSIPNKNHIYLLENIDKRLLNKNQLLISDVGDEIDTLENLIIDKYDASLHEQRSIAADDFKEWDEITKYLRPFSSMIIVDRFMFKGSDTGGNLGLFEHNLKNLLGHAFVNKGGNERLVFIFQIRPTDTPPDMGPDGAEMISKINRAVKSKNKHCKKPEIILVYVSKEIEDEHDRNIISNYFRIKSGDSFIYFDAANEIITQSSDIDFYSLGKLSYRKTTARLKIKLAEIIEEVRRLNPDRIVANFDLKGDIINF